MGCPCGGGAAGRGGVLRWLATQLLDLVGGLSDRIYGERKRALLGPLTGVVVEIGPGSVGNFNYLGPGVRWIGVEPNVHARSKLLKHAAERGVPADVYVGVAEHLPLADSSADAAVATLVLCSVDDVAATLREILRVLRPGGSFVFIEHVAAEQGTALRSFQDAIAPLWRWCADGCHANRETGRMLDEAGFERVIRDQFRVASPMVHLAPHIAGAATKGMGPI